MNILTSLIYDILKQSWRGGREGPLTATLETNPFTVKLNKVLPGTSWYRVFFISLKEVMYLKLTIKQQRFADEYIISGNATDAAIKAGYAKRAAYQQGAENLKKPHIREYIDKRLEEINDKSIAKQEEVLQYLTSVMRGTSQSAVVVIEGDGDGVSSARLMDKTPDEKEKLKAAELLGKRYGAFTEKVEVGADLELNVKVDYGDGND